MQNLKPNFLDVLQGKEPIKPIVKRELPTFQCQSCGNCEKNYHADPVSNINNGFCVKFFQNVALDEKNLKCWTSKPHKHFEDLSQLRPKELLKDSHKLSKRANHLDIQFTNQLNIFS